MANKMYYTNQIKIAEMCLFCWERKKKRRAEYKSEQMIACFVVQWQASQHNVYGRQEHSDCVYRLPADADDTYREQITCS